MVNILFYDEVVHFCSCAVTVETTGEAVDMKRLWNNGGNATRDTGLFGRDGFVNFQQVLSGMQSSPIKQSDSPWYVINAC